MRKITRKGVIRKLDKLVSEYVRQRDRACVVCGSRENLTCGHLFSRVSYSTRWDLGNCFAQCLSCNMRHEFEPYRFFKWYIDKFGQRSLDELDRKHNTNLLFKTCQLEELYKDIEEKKAKLKDLN